MRPRLGRRWEKDNLGLVAMSPSNTWKKTELHYAKALNGRREHFGSEDVSHPVFAIEVKSRSRKNYPARLRNWYEQARINSPDGKIPLLAIHLKNELYDNDLIILKRSDFEALFKRLTVQDIRRQEASPMTAGTHNGEADGHDVTGTHGEGAGRPAEGDPVRLAAEIGKPPAHDERAVIDEASDREERDADARQTTVVDERADASKTPEEREREVIGD